MKRALIALSLVAALALSGCDKMSEPFKDAPRGDTNSGPADTITFPDGFSNASTKCDHGNRVYVVFHHDAAYGSIAVVPQDPTCASTATSN